MDCKTRKRVLYREYVKALSVPTLGKFEMMRKIAHFEQMYPDFPMIYEEEYGESDAKA